MKISDSSEILKTKQIWSGTIFFKNNKFAREILDKWSSLLNINKLIDDSPSISKNHKDFIEHRHDQSLFSLLCKKIMFIVSQPQNANGQSQIILEHGIM